jgi:hypothetical protein
MHESAVISNLGRAWIHGLHASGVAVENQPREGRSGSGAAGDPAGIDVENLT